MSIGTDLDLDAILAEYHAEAEGSSPARNTQDTPEAEQHPTPSTEATTVFSAHSGTLGTEKTEPRRPEIPPTPEKLPQRENEALKKPRRSLRKVKGMRKMALVLAVLTMALAACLWWALGEERNAQEQEPEPLQIDLTEALESELESAATQR